MYIINSIHPISGANNCIMSNEGSSKGRSLRSSSRPSLLKEVDVTALSLHFGISLSSGSESSDKEFTPPKDDDGSDASEETSSEEEEEAVVTNDEEEYLELAISAANSDNSKVDDISDKPYKPICFVCLETSRHNDIVSCDKCGISVHEGCYGVPEDDGIDETRSDLSSFSTVPWFCDPCKAGIDNPSCDLCPCEGGLFKQCVNGCWIHMVCGLYCEGVEYVEPKLLSGITLDEIAPSRWGTKVCVLCEDEWLNQTGICISCDAGLCKTYFHATCAQRHGLLCEAEDDDDEDDDDEDDDSCHGNKVKRRRKEKEVADLYYAHCLVHCDKNIAKKKKEKFIEMMRYINSYKQPSDCRLDRYLSEAKQDYKQLYNRMKEWYHPEKAIKKGQRLLHHHPGAYKSLTEKAQLLGYSTTQIPQLSRQHFGMTPVGLTVEFVNYFNERSKKIESLKSDHKTLTATASDLKKKYKEIQEERKTAEQELETAKELWEQRTKEINDLCTKGNKLSDKEIFDPAKYISQEIQDEVTNHVTNHTQIECCICNGSHDDHLIVHCDTCHNMYHIMCLDPPLARVPKKTSKIGWQCEDCCCDSETELKPAVAKDTDPKSRFGRKLNNPRIKNWQLYSPEVSPVKVKKSRKRKRAN